MPPKPETTPTIALQSLLSEIHSKKHVLANMSKEARRTMDDEDRDAVIQLRIETDALLTVAEAIVLASLKGAT